MSPQNAPNMRRPENLALIFQEVLTAIERLRANRQGVTDANAFRHHTLEALRNAANQALVDPNWAGFPSEVYLFAAFVYFCFCFSMSRYSKYLEIELNKGTRR